MTMEAHNLGHRLGGCGTFQVKIYPGRDILTDGQTDTTKIIINHIKTVPLIANEKN